MRVVITQEGPVTYTEHEKNMLVVTTLCCSTWGSTVRAHSVCDNLEAQYICIYTHTYVYIHTERTCSWSALQRSSGANPERASLSCCFPWDPELQCDKLPATSYCEANGIHVVLFRTRAVLMMLRLPRDKCSSDRGSICFDPSLPYHQKLQ